MEKFICIHGHFYQPPRENPWLESVELQDSAWPNHDWNERITMECYAPNTAARILDGEGRISEIISNYSRISFNFGPTLLSWMRDKMPDIHDAIVASDRISQEKFSGHGSAMAQVYNHMILPLANTRDKMTQVRWGIRDFEFRFGRQPEGLWLAETAADTASLEALAAQGIKFTLLSPFQASRTREIGKRNWRDVNGGQIDPTRPYLARLPSGKTIVLFFYDGPVSQAVAFEHLLSRGEHLANRLMSAFDDRRQWEQLVHIATDGESYGHHHRHGEMGLAYALQYIESNHLARLTNYGEFLEKHPPTHEVQIHEPSAWSCSHGVGRWMQDCGCNSGGHAGWSQGWRAPLRQSLDWLRDELAPLYESKTAEYLKDPWAARNDYISVILDRSPDSREAFFSRHSQRELNADEKVTVFKLMELQRHAMLMYTSCGWFFDEISGIESVQVVQYAARAIQLAQEVFGKDLEPGFLSKFEGVKSNIPEQGDGRRIYENLVKPAMIDMPKAMAHYAVSSLFRQYGKRTRVFSFEFDDEERVELAEGKTRLAVGRARIVSQVTQEADVMSYAVLYLGEHSVTGAVRKFDTPEEHAAMLQAVRSAYETADFPETIRQIDRNFGGASFSLRSLFKDEQRRILNEILVSTREDLEGRFKLITERYEPLMKFLESIGAPLPSALRMASDQVRHSEIRRELQANPIDFPKLASLLDDAVRQHRQILDADLSFVAKDRLEQMIQKLAEAPENIELVRTLSHLAELVMPLPIGLNSWKVQNTYWNLLQKVLPELRQRAVAGDESARVWVESFLQLGEKLSFTVKHLAAPEALPAAA